MSFTVFIAFYTIFFPTLLSLFLSLIPSLPCERPKSFPGEATFPLSERWSFIHFTWLVSTSGSWVDPTRDRWMRIKCSVSKVFSNSWVLHGGKLPSSIFSRICLFVSRCVSAAVCMNLTMRAIHVKFPLPSVLYSHKHSMMWHSAMREITTQIIHIYLICDAIKILDFLMKEQSKLEDNEGSLIRATHYRLLHIKIERWQQIIWKTGSIGSCPEVTSYYRSEGDHEASLCVHPWMLLWRLSEAAVACSVILTVLWIMEETFRAKVHLVLLKPKVPN